MRGADDARVDRDRLAAADPLDHALLEEAQQLDLQRQRNVADLVEEQGAALRHLDLADVRLDRAGEGAALVAEQLGLQQGLGDGGAVDGDELALAAALLVNRAGEQFLAGAGRAEQHDRYVGGGDALDGLADLQHLRSGADDRAEHLAAAGLLEPAVLRLDVGDVEGAGDDQAELVDVDRLAVEIVGAKADRLQHAFASAVAGRDDDLRVGLQPQDVGQRGEAFGRAVRDRAEGRGRG